MARVQGPLHSDAASGTFNGTITYSTWKGRPYARTRVDPTNPKSAKQLGVRAMLAFIAPLWAALGAPAKASWDALAAAASTSAFNEYCKYAWDRWQNSAGPTTTYPAAEASTALTITTMGLTGGAGQVSIQLTPSGATNIWGMAIFRDTAEITVPSWANCIAIVEADGANAVTWIDSPLAAGTYHYRSQVLNIDGKVGAVKADATAVVT
jgi:hypothetical protein